MSNSVTVATRKGRITVEVEVFGQGEPLLYLHGPFGFVERVFVEALAQRFRVYVPAHPGFSGTSGYEELDDSVLDLALHYDEVLDALNLEVAVDLVGHSYGAFIAEELAAIFPARVRRLALISPLGIWLDDAPQPDLFGLTPGSLAAVLFRDPSAAVAASMFRPPEDRVEAMRWNAARRKSATGSAKYLWPIPDKGFRRRAHRVHSDTLIVWGKDDKVVAAEPYLRAYRELLPSAKTKLVENAGHMVVLEEPREVADAVLAYLNSAKA